MTRLFSKKTMLMVLGLTAGTVLTIPVNGKAIITDAKGILRIDGVATLAITHYSDKWVPDSQEDPSFKPTKTENDGKTFFSTAWNMRGFDSPVNVSIEQAGAEGDNNVVRYHVWSDKAVPTSTMSLQIAMPAWTVAGKPVYFDKKKFLLPTEFRDFTVFKELNIKRIEIPLINGFLDIELPVATTVELLDMRKFKKDQFCIRIAMLPESKELKDVSLEAGIRFIAYQTEPIDIAGAANMGFVDQVAGDKQGGWTDQGPTNDLRSLKPGRLSMPPATMNILDPAKNQGKSCIVLGGGGLPYMPSTAELPVAGKEFKTVFLLHALAWPPKNDTVIGNIRVKYQDGTEATIPVTCGKDVQNWWSPISLSNATIGWSAYSAESPVGLYLAPFELSGKPLASLTLESNGTSVWMIVGATGSMQALTLAQPLSYQVFRNADWRPLETDRTVVAGSALDFSFLQDAPAGKYGFIKTSPAGHFVFENRPDVPVRFYGANLCFTANYNSKEECDILAERLARIGYNAVRLHHFDRDIIMKDAKNSSTLDPKNLDRFEYLVYALKQKGIYITTDLFTVRRPVKGEYKSYENLGLQDYKAAAMLLPEVRNNLKAFARTLLTHVNPYTKLAWKDDPTIIGISLINENTILHIITPQKLTPEVMALYDAAFEQWTKKHDVKITPKNKDAEYRRFLISVYDTAYADLSQFMRELGVKAPLTDQNYISLPYNTVERSKYDYVDNHVYWDHPQFVGKAWTLPTKFNNGSVMESRLNVPKNIAASRVFGKPFTVTEFDFCYPNETRAEGGPIFGAYSAMQDWSGIYRFAYSHNSRGMFNATPGLEVFDVVNDPPRLLGERVGMVFFLRRDVTVADVSFPVAVSRKSWQDPFLQSYPIASTDLMLFGKVGSVLYDGNGKFTPGIPADAKALYNLTPELAATWIKLPLLKNQQPNELMKEMLAARLITAGEADLDKDIFASATGELVADFRAATFKAVTKRSEALVIPEGKTVKGAFLSAKTVKNFAVFAAVAVDNQELLKSKRILLLHLTDVKQEKMKFASREMRLLLENGNGQILAKKGVAEISLSTGNSDDCQLYALDCSGRRLKKIPFKVQSGVLSFIADTFGADKIVFAYELTRQ